MPPLDQPELVLPTLPTQEDLLMDKQSGLFPLLKCSFCVEATTTNRCGTIVTDSEPHYFFAGEARCSRAFCLSCSHTIAPGPGDFTVRTSTCPFHLLQGSQSDLLAGAGPNSKNLADNYLPIMDASSDEPGPSSNGAEVL